MYNMNIVCMESPFFLTGCFIHPHRTPRVPSAATIVRVILRQAIVVLGAGWGRGGGRESGVSRVYKGGAAGSRLSERSGLSVNMTRVRVAVVALALLGIGK